MFAIGPGPQTSSPVDREQRSLFGPRPYAEWPELWAWKRVAPTDWEKGNYIY